MVMGYRLPSDCRLANLFRGDLDMTRYGQHQTEAQVDADWATLDVTVHWTLDRDDDRDLLSIDKITVGNKDLYEGWNYDYFEALIQEELESRE